jgi:LysR family hca operon transcriptional activator
MQGHCCEELRPALASASVELRHLKYFVAVSEELNFTRAAARLHAAQPSLSQQIRQLEKHVGVRLLDRSHHHVALTNAGRIFLHQARDILGRVEHATRLAKQAADGRAGDLSVGTFPSADVRILPALRPLVAEHLPDLRLILHCKYAVEPVAGLRSGALDVAFMRGPLEADGLEHFELLRENLVIVLPSHHALARRRRIPVSSLDDLPCITLGDGCLRRCATPQRNCTGRRRSACMPFPAPTMCRRALPSDRWTACWLRP